MTNLAFACAIVDIMRKGGRTVEDSIALVVSAARPILRVGASARFISQLRKDLRSGRRSELARTLYESPIRTVDEAYSAKVAEMKATGPDGASGLRSRVL